MNSQSQPSPPIADSSMADDITTIKYTRASIPHLYRETQNVHTLQQILELQRKCILALKVEPSSELFKSLFHEIGPLKHRIEDRISHASEAKMQYQLMRAQRYLCKYGKYIDETTCAAVGLTKGSPSDKFLEEDWLYLRNDDQWRKELGQSKEERYTRPLMSSAIEAAKVCGDNDIEEMILEINAYCSGSQTYNEKSFDELRDLGQFSQIAEILVKDYHGIDKYLGFSDNLKHREALAVYMKMGIRKFQARIFTCIEETLDEKEDRWKISYYDIVPSLRKAGIQRRAKEGAVDVISKEEKKLLLDFLGVNMESKATKKTRRKKSKKAKAKTSQSTADSKEPENLFSPDRVVLPEDAFAPRSAYILEEKFLPDEKFASDSDIDISSEEIQLENVPCNETSSDEELIGGPLHQVQTWPERRLSCTTVRTSYVYKEQATRTNC